MANVDAQRSSGGRSHEPILAAALDAADPIPGLSWLDVGCGTGGMLRAILDGHRPSRLVGIDIIDWLDADLADAVDMHVGPAEETIGLAPPVDRVLLVEALEHLEAPWAVLRMAARLVLPGGRLVLTTPNISSLRHRLELPAKGRLTYFRTGNVAHLQPILPHVAERILREEGLDPQQLRYAAPDVIPLSGGRIWPNGIAERLSSLLCISVVISAVRPL
jgi:2-polyprenyl-3-methyl-5-hydroxy-6-metoxy-1,4-benzoquinol methylase